MSAFGGEADIGRHGTYYPPRGQRCLSVGDQCGYLFTTVRFAYAEAFLTIRAGRSRAAYQVSGRRGNRRRCRRRHRATKVRCATACAGRALAAPRRGR